MSDNEIFKDPEKGGRLTSEPDLKSDRFVGISEDFHTPVSAKSGSYYLEKEQLIESNENKDKQIQELKRIIDGHNDKLRKTRRQLIDVAKSNNDHVKLLIQIKEIIDECKKR